MDSRSDDTAAKFLVENLLTQGIDTYFGVPGGPISPMFDAVLRTPGVFLIESRQETAALWEAIGYYKVTGKVPVVLVSAGPGIANSLNGIASAKALRVPLLVMSGEVNWENSEQILLQSGGPDGLDLETTFSPHTEKVLRFKDAENVSKEMLRFLQIREGAYPSLFVLPMNISNAIIKHKEIEIGKINRQLNTHNQIFNEVAKLIFESGKPLLLLGNGAKKFPAQIYSLIKTLQIPFATTPQGKGAGSDLDPLCLRNIGLGASKWSREYLKEAPDLVLVLGTDLDDCAIGTVNLADDNTKIIHVDLNNKVFNRKFKTHLGIVEDIGLFANALDYTYQQLCKDEEVIFNGNTSLQILKSNSPYEEPLFYQDDNIPIAPHRAIADLNNAIPYATFVTDIGEHMLFALHYLNIEHPSGFSIDLGLGSMGSGICQAIGMAIGHKTSIAADHPIICICGDGCMQMHGMEILTAIKYKLPIIFAIFNDARYNMVYHGFSFLFGHQENLGQTDYIDFVKFADALGIQGKLITQPGEITNKLLKSLLDLGKPSILDIRINKDIRLKGAGRNEALKQMGEFDG